MYQHWISVSLVLLLLLGDVLAFIMPYKRQCICWLSIMVLGLVGCSTEPSVSSVKRPTPSPLSIFSSNYPIKAPLSSDQLDATAVSTSEASATTAITSTTSVSSTISSTPMMATINEVKDDTFSVLQGPPSYHLPGLFVSFSPKGHYLLLSPNETTLTLYETATGQQVQHFTTKPYKHWFSFSPDDQLLALTGSGGITLYYTNTGQFAKKIQYDGLVGTLKFSSTGKYLAMCGDSEGSGTGGPVQTDATAHVWELTTSKELLSFTSLCGIDDLAFNADDTLFAIANNGVGIYSLPKGELKYRLTNSGFALDRPLVFSPDGNSIAIGPFIYDIVSGTEQTRLFVEPDVAELMFLPDQKAILTYSHFSTHMPGSATNEVWRWSWPGGSSTFHLGHTVLLSMRADGRYIAATPIDAEGNTGYIGIWDLHGTSDEPVVKITDSQGASFHFNPDENTVALMTGVNGTLETRIWTRPTAAPVSVTNTPLPIAHTVSPTAVPATATIAVEIPVLISNTTDLRSITRIEDVSLQSPLFVSVRQDDHRTWRIGVLQPAQRELTYIDVPGNVLQPSLAPDGATLAFVTNYNDTSEITLLNLASKQTQSISAAGTAAQLPSWSPDGKFVLYTSEPVPTQPYASHLFVYDRVNGSTRQLLDIHGGWARWSSRNEIVFTSWTGKSFDLFSVQPDGTGLTNLTNTDTTDEDIAAWSPDGEQIAFVRHPRDRLDERAIYTMDRDGQHVQQQTHFTRPCSNPVWSPDGQQLAFVYLTAPDTWQIWMTNGPGAEPHPLTNNTDRVWFLQWSR